MEKYNKKKKDLYMVFINLEKNPMIESQRNCYYGSYKRKIYLLIMSMIM